MKAPLSWLKDYIDIDIPVQELADRLTLAGFEVAALEDNAGKWDNVCVAQIVGIDPHPDADRLRLATVDLGDEQETVVCGAPNLAINDKIAFARVGARMLNPHNGKMETLKEAKIRGVVSRGMICSEQELGISDSHEGILVLKPEAAVGAPLADILGDIVLDVDITPNRPDCLSIIGIAREAAAVTGQQARVPEITYEEAGAPIEASISIEVAAPDLCPRYCASLIRDVKICESPAWMQERLTAAGMRPINNIVDITNYVMLEYGQPLHSFDYDKIKGRQIVPRRAEPGEILVTLDDEERKLGKDMLVIGDGERAVAIAGVMGGANSEVTESTGNILLEAASFNAASIHFTGQNLNLASEAAMRFERGISAGVALPALKQATRLMAELGGGTVAKGIIDVYPGQQAPEPLVTTAAEMERILGVAFTEEQIAGTLELLGFGVERDGAQIKAVAPYWRSDIKYEVDIIEEVARIIGYDKIPTTLLSEPLPHQNPNHAVTLKDRLRQGLAGYGFQEVQTYSLTSLDMLNNLLPEADDNTGPEPLRMVNPMTADLEYLRPSLRPNLLSTLAANRRHAEGGLRLFELGKIFIPREKDLPDEPEVLCGLLCGDRVEASWLGGDGNYDFYDAKGMVEALLTRLGIAAGFEKGKDPGLHPARQAAVVVKNGGMSVTLGHLGELHPKVADTFEIDVPVCMFEINVTSLLPFTTEPQQFQPIARFPGTVRDLALVVDTPVTHRQVTDIINDFPLVSEVQLFDVYAGQQVGGGKKSLAYRVVYQSPSHTLTDEDVNKVQARILKRLESELGATLRG